MSQLHPAPGAVSAFSGQVEVLRQALPHGAEFAIVIVFALALVIGAATRKVAKKLFLRAAPKLEGVPRVGEQPARFDDFGLTGGGVGHCELDDRATTRGRVKVVGPQDVDHHARVASLIITSRARFGVGPEPRHLVIRRSLGKQ